MTQPATSLAGKTALVTGPATGIGRAIAATLAAAGARVVINHPPTPELAGPVRAGIEAAGGQALAIAADMSKRSEYQLMVERMLGEYGRWDILVKNVAVAVTKPFAQISEAEFDLSFSVNVNGVFHGLQLAWEHSSQRRHRVKPLQAPALRQGAHRVWFPARVALCRKVGCWPSPTSIVAPWLAGSM